MLKVDGKIKVQFRNTLRKHSTILLTRTKYMGKNFGVQESFSTALGYGMGGNRKKDLDF